MNRRTFIGTLAGGLLAAPLAAEAQQTGKVYRIGFLSSTRCPFRPENMGPFRQGLLEFGYVEGQNITIECRGARGATDHLSVLAAELVLLNVDVLVAVGTTSAQAAKHATNTIPIVMIYVGDPVGSGLVTNLARLEATSRACLPSRPAWSAALRQHAEALFVHPLPLELRDVRRIAQFAITTDRGPQESYLLGLPGRRPPYPLVPSPSQGDQSNRTGKFRGAAAKGGRWTSGCRGPEHGMILDSRQRV
jgi:Fe2+ transport system protein FeoA